MSELRRTPFHRALHRSNLILGGQREPMIFCLFITAMLMIVSMNILSFIAGILFGFITVVGLREMAKADPQMIAVLRRQVWYREYYPTYSRPFRKSQSKRVY